MGTVIGTYTSLDNSLLYCETQNIKIQWRESNMLKEFA